MPTELSRPRTLPRIADAVRLGIFLPNQRNAFFITSADGMSDAGYDVVRRVAVLSEETGLSFLLPVARWKGVRGDAVDFCPYGLETVTLTSGLLEATSRITCFTTMHTELFNPVIAAQMGATMDHIGNGRWGLNVVAGWSQADFHSMGLELREHEDRYAHAQSWLTAVRELWEKGESSHTSPYFVLDGAECLPRPVQEGGPVVVNAGHSPTGIKFAVDNADYLFTTDANADQLRMINDEMGGGVGYIGRRFVIVRKTRAEAEAVADAIVAGGDRRAQAALFAHGDRAIEEAAAELATPGRMREIMLKSASIGSPEDVAAELADWAATSGVDGICLTLFDAEQELEILAEDVYEQLGDRLASHGKALHLER